MGLGQRFERGLSRLVCTVAVALTLGCGAVGVGTGAAEAQSSPFSPVVFVNNRVISGYEVSQRLLFLQILRQPGDLEEMALQGLIDDRLRMGEAKRLGITIGPDAVKAGMEEFASRANLSADEFIKIVGQAGIQAQTFRDFVEAGVIWRDVVRARYAGTITITDAEVDRALSNFKPTSAIKVRVAEIVLPASGTQRSNALALAGRLKLTIKSDAEFAAAARSNSAGPTAANGGVTGWQRLSALPEAAVPAIRRLAPGQISAPVVLDDKVVLYQLLETGEDKLGANTGTVLDYAEFLFPDGAGSDAEAAKIRSNLDTCGDLYAVAKGLPAERLTFESRPQSEVPGDVAAALQLLDAGESSTALRRGGWRVFLMLCSRGAPKDLLPPREEVRTQLLNQRLSAQAEVFLEELRSEAIIRRP